MRLLIDDANIEKIRRILEYYPCDGVTTNPSSRANTGRPPDEVVQEIRARIGPRGELHVQAISADAEGMLAEAEKITRILGKNTYIKIPAIPEGIKAMKALKAAGYRVTATAIYTPMQAYLSAKAGADYVAPYINRIDNLGADGIATAKMIHNILVNNGYETKVLAASFKNSQQVQALCEAGVGAATANPDIIEGLIRNQSVAAAVEAFVADFQKLCGDGKTMLDC